MKKILLGFVILCTNFSFGQVLSEDFESVTTPALPNGWTATTKATNGYTGYYTGYYTGAKNYSGTYSGAYSGSYTGYYAGTSAYSGTYAGTYTGYYSGDTIQSSSENVSNVALWVKTAN